jgi:hypothetical protein
MTAPIPLSLTLIAGAFVFASMGTIPPLSTPIDPDPIARLDECIQRRFLGIGAFGMARVLPNRYHGVVQFRSENAAEQQAVAELTEKGYHVALFLAGRHVLDQPSQYPSPRFGLQGPALVASLDAAVALPDRETLLAEGRKAMQSLVNDQNGSGYDVRQGNWVIAMRPLRASNETCVRCHTTGFGALIRDGNRHVELGDALGVAMYVYRR